MDRCKKNQNRLAAYRTGTLGERRCRAVEAHLLECAECARELDSLDRVLALVEDQVGQVEPPPGLWNGVYNRITAPAAGTSASSAIRRWLARPAHAVGVAMAILAIAFGTMLGGLRRQPAPARVAQLNEYVQGHVLYAGQAHSADRVSYLSLVAASSQPGGAVR